MKIKELRKNLNIALTEGPEGKFDEEAYEKCVELLLNYINDKEVIDIWIRAFFDVHRNIR
jgi:hypothetical protein